MQPECVTSSISEMQTYTHHIALCFSIQYKRTRKPLRAGADMGPDIDRILIFSHINWYQPHSLAPYGPVSGECVIDVFAQEIPPSLHLHIKCQTLVRTMYYLYLCDPRGFEYVQLLTGLPTICHTVTPMIGIAFRQGSLYPLTRQCCVANVVLFSSFLLFFSGFHL